MADPKSYRSDPPHADNPPHAADAGEQPSREELWRCLLQRIPELEEIIAKNARWSRSWEWDAEDALQETILEGAETIDSGQARQLGRRRWPRLKGAARNQAANVGRKIKRRRKREVQTEEWVFDQRGGSDERAAELAEECRLVIRAAAEALDPRWWRVLWRIGVEKACRKEVAQELGVTVDAVRGILQRALPRLRELVRRGFRELGYDDDDFPAIGIA